MEGWFSELRTVLLDESSPDLRFLKMPQRRWWFKISVVGLVRSVYLVTLLTELAPDY